MGAMPISGRRSRGEDGRPLRLRTPAIRRNRPTVQGPPAFSPAQCPRAGCRPILPQSTSGVMLKTTRFRASIWNRTAFQNAVFKLSYEAVREWEAKLTPALADDLRRRRRGTVGRSWYVDETYLKVHGRWCYLYRAIDRTGTLVDVLFSEHRDMEAAQAFFRSAKAVTGVTPDRV